MTNKTLWVAGAACVLVLSWGIYLLYANMIADKAVAVTNFEECVAAGNAVMESYPRQCAADGVTYVEEIEGLPVEAMMTGRTGVCLPKKDTGGPVTLECAMGFEADTGEYYALDIPESLSSQELVMGADIVARGFVVPAMALSTDQWQTYDIVGVFSVQEVISVNGAAYDGGDGGSNPGTDPSRPYQPLPPGDGTEPIEPSEPPVSGACYVGGCSGQLCSDQPGMASTCEWREEYACYRESICERQANGQCGWTETEATRACKQGTITY